MGWLAALLACAAVAAGAEAKLDIQWRKTWAETYRTNSTRWQKEIAAEVRDGVQRQERLRRRQIRLLEAMVARPDYSRDQKLTGRQEILGHLRALGEPERANQEALALLGRNPGDTKLAAELLYEIMRSPGREDPSRWRAYAADRLIALHEGGWLPGAHAMVVAAWKMQAELAMADGRHEAVPGILSAIAAAGGEADWARAWEGYHLLRAGRLVEAHKRIEDRPRVLLGARWASDYANRLEQRFMRAPMSPIPMGLTLRDKWGQLQERALGAQLDFADGLLGEVAGDPSLTAQGRDLHRATWLVMQAYFRGQSPAAIAALRKYQERKLHLPEMSPESLDTMTLFRRFPFSITAQRRMLDWGRRMLRAGRAGPATRAFEDVLTFAADRELRAGARAGQWLASAQARGVGAGAIEAAFKAAGASASYPWMGGRRAAKEVRGQLQASVSQVEAPAGRPRPLGQLRQRLLKRLPPQPAWPLSHLLWLPPEALSNLWYWRGRVFSLEGDLFVTASNLLARFDGSTGRRVWLRTTGLVPDAPARVSGGVALSPPTPAVVDGRILCQWGQGAGAAHHTSLAAMDLATGRTLWRTDGDPAWGRLTPLSDPVAADGRLYVLAFGRGTADILAVYLICQDPRDGRVLWTRQLGVHEPSNTLRHGGAVTVRDGQVYCATGAGFVARCDARDGMVEWVRYYARYLEAPPGALARHPAGPIVDADRVVFVPRDSGGAFALDRATGEKVWDSPWAPAGRVLGVFDGAMVTAEGRMLAVVDLKTGRVRWRKRLDEKLAGGAVLEGEWITAGSSSGLRRISARDGTVRDRAKWASEPMYDFALRGDEVVGIAGTSVEAPGPAVLNAGERASKARLEIPLDSSWSLPRSTPGLLTPPERAGASDHVYMVSDGVLECLRLDGKDRLVWRRFLPPRVKILWGPKMLLAVHQDRVVALDPLTGGLRWRYLSDHEIHRPKVHDSRLILADLRPTGNVVSLLDLASGKRLWRRNYVSLLKHYEAFHDVPGWDGRRVHLLLSRFEARRQAAWDLVCDAKDGRVVARHTIPPPSQGRQPQLGAVHCGQATLTYAGVDRGVYHCKLGAGAPVVRKMPAPGLPRTTVRITVDGPWVKLWAPARRLAGQSGSLYLRTDSPSFRYTAPPGVREVLQDGRLYEMRGRVVTPLDPNGKKGAVRYEIPEAVANKWTAPFVLSFRRVGERMLVLSGFSPTLWHQQWGRSRPRLRVDAYDAKSGRHENGQTLDGHWTRNTPPTLAYGEMSRMIWRDGVLLVAGPQSLFAYRSPAAGDSKLLRPVRIIYRKPAVMKIDGVLDEWDAGSRLPMRGPDASTGKVMLTQDDKHLYIAATHPNLDLHPRIAGGDLTGGDYLEIATHGWWGDRRFIIAPGVDRMVRIEDAGTSTGRTLHGSGIRAVIRHDLAAGQVTYEVALPFSAFTHSRYRPEKMELSLTVWDQRDDEGSVPVMRFGRGALGRQMMSDLNVPLHFTGRTLRQEKACLAICRDAPLLDESLDFIWNYRLGRAPDPERRRKAYEALTKAYARTPRALPLLMKLGQWLQVDLDADATDAVLAIAEQAGVSPRVRERYKALTRSYLTLWVYVNSEAERVAWPPRVQLYLRFFDGGRGRDAWDHGVSWVCEYDPGRTRSDLSDVHVADQQMRPYNKWLQLRVPLMWAKMEDRPIHGLGFMTNFGMYATIDRIVIGDGRGKETVLMDDAFPPGRASGGFKWVEKPEPVKSGTKAIRPLSWSYGGYFNVVFDKPVTTHLLPPFKPDPGPDPALAAGPLKENIPKLDGCMEGWRFFQALLRVAAGEDARKRIELYRWYLRVNPNSPRLLLALRRLWEQHQAIKTPDPTATIEADLAAAKVRAEVAYTFRSDYAYAGQAFLKDWQVIGPFTDATSDGSAILPPERLPVDLTGVYEGMSREVRWQRVRSETDRISLDKIFGQQKQAAAFAVCWIHSDKAQPAVIEFGMDDVGSLWLNRTRVLAGRLWGRPRPAIVSKRIQLRKGWNEMMVKVVNGILDWGFWLEVVDVEGRGLPAGVRLSATGPGR